MLHKWCISVVMARFLTLEEKEEGVVLAIYSYSYTAIIHGNIPFGTVV